jgi:HSP20 family molecular chaperone IbpA
MPDAKEAGLNPPPKCHLHRARGKRDHDTYDSQERSDGPCARAVPLPERLPAESCPAELKKGVLRPCVPRVQEAPLAASP